MRKLIIMLSSLLVGCQNLTLDAYFLSDSCIKPNYNYKYKTCNDINFRIDNQFFTIPKNFVTDLASIPRIAWPVISPFHSSLIAPAIVHDWFYRKTCDFNRKQADLILYYMLKNQGVSTFRASVIYYSTRLFGAKYYNEDYCE